MPSRSKQMKYFIPAIDRHWHNLTPTQPPEWLRDHGSGAEGVTTPDNHAQGSRDPSGTATGLRNLACQDRARRLGGDWVFLIKTLTLINV